MLVLLAGPVRQHMGAEAFGVSVRRRLAERRDIRLVLRGPVDAPAPSRQFAVEEPLRFLDARLQAGEVRASGVRWLTSTVVPGMPTWRR
jgi:hypothetical protein